MAASIESQLKELDKAKDLLKGDPSHYPQIVQGILPLAGQKSPALRRWVIQFLAEAFGSRHLSNDIKQGWTGPCLPIVQEMLGEKDEDILSYAIRCATSMYPLVFILMYVPTFIAYLSDVKTSH